MEEKRSYEKNFNKGKQMEVKDRFVHVNKLNDWVKK